MDTKAFSVLHGRANKYCRFCMVDRNEDPTIVCSKRTREAPLQQMAEISSLRTEQARPKLKWKHIMGYMKMTTLFYSFLLTFINAYRSRLSTLSHLDLPSICCENRCHCFQKGKKQRFWLDWKHFTHLVSIWNSMGTSVTITSLSVGETSKHGYKWLSLYHRTIFWMMENWQCGNLFVSDEGRCLCQTYKMRLTSMQLLYTDTAVINRDTIR